MQITRFKAFGIHLLLSLMFFSTLVIAMLVFWFPGTLFFVDGGIQGLKIVAMVDLVLGPLLTLVVYKPGKKTLKLDLAVIAAIQFAALGYGYYTTWNQHTVALVFSENQFVTLSRAAHVDANRELEARGEQPVNVASFGGESPQLLVTPLQGNYGKLLQETMNGYPEFHERSDHFVRLSDNYYLIHDQQLDAYSIRKTNDWPAIEKSLADHQKSIDEVDLYRFKARFGIGIALLDTDSRTMIDMIESKVVGSAADGAVAENDRR